MEDISKELSDRDIELLLVNDEEIQKINKESRGVDKATDVLSFPLEDFINTPLGTIVISLDQALSKAKELGHSVEDEIALLFIHGLLHLKGYDHESDDGQMRELERELIERFCLPKSLIIRSEG
jgi:probable rRNA maturation factor